MGSSLQQTIVDSLLAVLLFITAIAAARCLLLLFDRFAAQPLAAAEISQTHKLTTLESLRGLLALAVVAHHACCWYFFAHAGVWTTGNSILFDRLARFGVAQFFYLSGFLFWRNLRHKWTPAPRMPIARFYLSRLVRIAPLYYVSLTCALLIGFLLRGSALGNPANVPASLSTLLRSITPWLLFSLGGQPSVLHVDLGRITAGVSWTLALECLFYLALPLLGWFARRPWRLLPFALLFAGLHWAASQSAIGQLSASGPLNSLSSITATFAKFMLIGFGGGILLATLQERMGTAAFLKPHARSTLLLALYLAYLLIPSIAAAGQILLLAGFALVLQGADLFGLLASRPIRLLGAISYPIYLVHGIVFYAIVGPHVGAHAPTPLPFLALTAACVLITISLAMLLHVLIERPTLRISARLAGKVSERSAKRDSVLS